jgi:hypothetical protein
MLSFLDPIQNKNHQNLIQIAKQMQAFLIILGPLFILKHVLFYVILTIFVLLLFTLNPFVLFLDKLKTFLAFFIFFFLFFNIAGNINKFNELHTITQK